MQIGKNFKLSEFEYSQTAQENGIDNRIKDEGIKQNIIDLVTNVLQPICDLTGWHNRISSGYRCPELNKLVGGVPTSQHTKGQASDNKFYTTRNVDTEYLTSYEVAKKVVESGLTFDQLILYPTFVHISYNKGNNRNSVLYSKDYKGQRL